mmetsp:Transcript_58678/g.67772  ORF Transcript_58678/g.67772 Transcript_58678/m.67772 type:complete len:161 (+) Transcript_58678:31-513(+)
MIATEVVTKVLRPGVGVGILVWNAVEEKLLVTRYKKNGMISFPGGHLEKFESWESCASRELWEEAGLKVPESEMALLGVFNCFRKDKEFHFIDINLVCKMPLDQTVTNTEPDKHEDWTWMTFDQLKDNLDSLFYPIQDMLNKHSKLFNPANLNELLKNKK